MKALTLTQPWATLVVFGEKKFETRSWQSWYRGPLAIHAAKGFPKWAKELCATEPFAAVLAKHGIRSFKDIPTAAMLGVCDLAGCIRTEDVSLPTLSDSEERAIQEVTFGDYTFGRWAWRLENLRRFDKPIPSYGQLGIWEWEHPENIVQVLNEAVMV